MIKKIIATIVVLILIAAGIGIYQFNKKVPGLEDAKADYSLTSNELYDAFESNETEALTLYENKVIDVKGKVINIKNEGESSIIVLESENAMIGGINCSFGKIVHDIETGQTVTIRGRCQGILMDVILNNCIIIHE